MDWLGYLAYFINVEKGRLTGLPHVDDIVESAKLVEMVGNLLVGFSLALITMRSLGIFG